MSEPARKLDEEAPLGGDFVDTAPIPIVRAELPTAPPGEILRPPVARSRAARPPSGPSAQRSVARTATSARRATAAAVRAPEGTDSRRPAGLDRTSWSVAAVSGALWAAGVGLVAVVVIVLVGWVAAGHDGPTSGDALRASGLVWLISHHALLTTPGGTISLLPLGLMFVPIALTYRAGTWMARVSPPTSRADVLRSVGFACATYAAIAGLVSGIATLDSTQVSVAMAMAAAAIVSGAGFSAGVVHGLPQSRERVARLRQRAPLALRDVIRATTVGLITVIGVAAALAGISLFAHLDQAAAIGRSVAPGAGSGLFLTLVAVAYAPNFVMWATAYGLGTTVSLGTGGSVSVLSVQPTAVPAFPLFAVVPDTPNPWARALVLVPVVAGLLAGWLLVRTGRLTDLKSRVVGVGGVAALSALALGTLASLSAGALGGARLASMGPTAWAVALAGGGLIGMGALVFVGVAWLWDHRNSVPSLP